MIGLTGGIASGKSTVARMFAERGAAVIDADQLARQIVERADHTEGDARCVQPHAPVGQIAARKGGVERRDQFGAVGLPRLG